jgi:predicted metal-dependent enzyme (double-stranded beta helix superfamily)
MWPNPSQSSGRPKGRFAPLGPPLMSNVRPHLNQSAESKAWEILERVHESIARGVPSPQQLPALSEALRTLARSPVWQSCEYREASEGEELTYTLAVSPGDGPALYLVSDGASVSSKPHRHDTWAVIVGIRGHEVSHLYRRQAEFRNVVVPSSQVDVGPLSVLALNEQDIHSTEVHGPDATFHLHLYGRALHVLPSLASRCYSVGGVV